VIVTGANSGIGRVTAAALVRKGARVILAVRDEDRGRRAAADMHGEVEVWPLDLANLTSVREFAEKWQQPIDV
jgi:NAD(P)-dependent dehydrogenase (short-subunit alcohol dehydrogenase family)